MDSMQLKDILDSLDVVRYEGKIKDESTLSTALEAGTGSTEFTKLVSWLSCELQMLNKLEEKIHPVSGPEDEGAFLLEMNSFLKEIYCPYPSLTEGPISLRLSTVTARYELLNFLITELQAARISAGVKKVKLTAAPTSSASLKVAESPTAVCLKQAVIALGLAKPPETITSAQLFSKLIEKVKDHLSKLPTGRIGNALFMSALNDKQWETAEKINAQMKIDYRTRCDMLLQRLDVTVQSFSWSDRVKKREDEILRVYHPLRQALKTESRVNIADLLAARDDLTLVEKTSNSNLRSGTKTKLNKLLMKAQPPDRGGRPTEIQPPAPEMPSWQKRTPGGGRGHQRPQDQRQQSRGGGGRGRGGGGNSGRVQGVGWQGGDPHYNDPHRNEPQRQQSYPQNQAHNYGNAPSYDQQYSYSGGQANFMQQPHGAYTDYQGPPQHDYRGGRGGGFHGGRGGRR